MNRSYILSRLCNTCAQQFLVLLVYFQDEEIKKSFANNMVHKASSVYAEVELLEEVRIEEQRRHKSVSILGQVSK